jgi:hypothetical protein
MTIDFFGRNQTFERFFIGIILLTLWCFAYYFTSSDLEEVQSRFANKRAVLVKLLAREVTNLLNRREPVEPRLAGLLAEEAVSYAIVQQPEGEIVAQVSQIPVEALQKMEGEALKTPYMKFLPFTDPTGLVPMVEGVMPIFPDAGKKNVLRIGFRKAEEEERINQVLFRNVLLFSTLILGLGTYWLIRRRGASGVQATWLAGTGLLALILFLATRFTIQEWYDRFWRQTFVQHGMSISKVISIPVKRFLHSNEETDLKELHALLEKTDENYIYFGIVKDERYIFHSNPYTKGTEIKNPDYIQILNTDKPFTFKRADEEIMEILIPITDGQRKLGTLLLGFKPLTGFGPLTQLRNKIVLLFVAFLVLALSLVYLISRRISKDVALFIRSMEQVTAGDLRQNVYLNREDEFGQLAQAYNFMLMGLKERDLLGKGLQSYVSKSIVEKTLKVLSTEEKSGEKVFVVIIFGYFFGVPEALNQKKVTEVFAAIREVYQCFKRITSENSQTVVQMQLTGMTAIFSQHNRHETLMHALKAAQMLTAGLPKLGELPFSVKFAVHAQEVVYGALDEDNQNQAFLGESVPDFRALARNHETPQEILISEETSYLLREIAQLEEVEFHGNESGHSRAFVFQGFKSPESLVKMFPEANPWTKTLILKLLKGYAREEYVDTLVKWFGENDPDIRYHIMDALERLRPVGIVPFIIKVIGDEQDARVLSKAISILGKIGNESHIPLLAEKLRTGDRRVKANTVEALETIGGKKVYEFLNLLVDEPDNRVKANILIALGKYGDLKVFDLLSRMIKDPDKNIRASAAYALGRLGMVQGVEPLIASLSDKDLSVRRQVVASLTALKADLEIDS